MMVDGKLLEKRDRKGPPLDHTVHKLYLVSFGCYLHYLVYISTLYLLNLLKMADTRCYDPWIISKVGLEGD